MTDDVPIVQTTTGLRPYRAGGYRVELERLHDGRPLVHNYGHGGSGVTISWGTAEDAAALVLGTGAKRAAVLGAGVVGLSTARVLQEAGVAVTVYTRDLPPQTTSVVAGALWAPFALLDPEHCTEAMAATLTDVCARSRARFDALDRTRYGLRDLPLWVVGVDTLGWEMSATGAFRGEPDDPRRAGIAADSGWRDDTGLLIDPTIYLPALLDDVRRAGGEVRQQTFATLDEVSALDEDVIVNCTGLGARALFGDESLQPIKGQLVHLEPDPAIDVMLLDEASGTYVFPRPTSTVLGGSFVPGEWSLDADPDVSARILERALALLPRLAGPVPSRASTPRLR